MRDALGNEAAVGADAVQGERHLQKEGGESRGSSHRWHGKTQTLQEPTETLGDPAFMGYNGSHFILNFK